MYWRKKMGSESIVKQLKENKATLEELRTKKSRLEGKRDQLMETLKTKFNVSSVEEAEKLLVAKEAELTVNEGKIVDLVKKMDAIIEKAKELGI
jgi:predicted transcriptional regulator